MTGIRGLFIQNHRAELMVIYIYVWRAGQAVCLVYFSMTSFETKNVYWSVNWHHGGGLNFSKKWSMILGFSPLIVNPIEVTLT